MQVNPQEIEALKAERSTLESKVHGLQMDLEALKEQQKWADGYAASLVEHIQYMATMKLDVNGQVLILLPHLSILKITTMMQCKSDCDMQIAIEEKICQVIVVH